MDKTDTQQPVSPAGPGDQTGTPAKTGSTPQKPGILPPVRRLIPLAVAWTVLILAVWYALHPLFDIQFPLYPAEVTGRIGSALLSLGLDAGLLVLAALASGLVGWHLLGLAWAKGAALLAPAERLLFSLGLGLGANTMLILGLGVLGGVNSVVAYLLLGLELALLWPVRSGLGRSLPEASRSAAGWWRSSGWVEKILAAGTGLLALATLLVALAPPVAWDALMYHLEGPRLYIQAGRMEPLPRLGTASYPFGLEMLFTWGMLLHGDGLAQAFSWLFGLLGAAGCLVFAQKFFPRLDAGQARRAGLLAAALYLSVPQIWLLMTWAYTDTMIAFYVLLSFYALLLALEKRSIPGAAGLAALSGVMAGLSCGGKYTAILAAFGILAGVAAIGGLSATRPTYRQLWLGLLVFGASGTLAFLPWLIRNLVFSGNPISPFFFGIRGWEPEEIAALTGKDGGVDLSPAVVLGRPLQLVLQGRNNGLFDATISPLFLALLPLEVWAARREKVVAGLLLAVGLTYLGWLAIIKLSVAADETRLLLPVFPLLALATACALVDFSAFKEWGTRARPLRLAAGLATGLFLVTSGFWVALFFVANDPLPYHFGLQTRAERVESQLGAYYRAAAFVNGNLPADARLFLFFEPRAYYFDRWLSPDHNYGGQFFFYVTRYRTAPEVYAQLKQRGATHALVNEQLFNYVLKDPEYSQAEKAKAGRQLLDDLLAGGYFTEIYEEKGEYTIYRLK